jgi:ZIP family zinc transporter
MQFLEMSAGAFLAFASTAAGAAVILFIKKPGRDVYARIMSFSAGMMAFAAYEMLLQSHASSGDISALAGLCIGLSAFLALDRMLPHVHTILGRGARALPRDRRKAALLAGTITLHNIPEGFAIASAFAASPPLGWLVAASIAIQDFPEGLIVSAPLSAYGVESRHSFLWGAFSGLVEFAAAMAGFLFLSAVAAVTPFALAFSAGAMLYVTAFELLPDAFSGRKKLAPLLFLASGLALAFMLAQLFAAQ